MVIDQGGLGKAFAEEMRTRHRIPVEAAQKSEKATFVALLNDDLTAGHVHVRRGSPLAQEWALLPKDADDPLKEDPRFDNHCSDASALRVARGAALHRQASGDEAAARDRGVCRRRGRPERTRARGARPATDARRARGGRPVVTPEEFRAYVRVAREEGVGAFEIGDFKVSLAKSAFVPKPRESHADSIAKALEKRVTADPITDGEDDDLFASAGGP
jgi:hypothetical protein